MVGYRTRMQWKSVFCLDTPSIILDGALVGIGSLDTFPCITTSRELWLQIALHPCPRELMCEIPTPSWSRKLCWVISPSNCTALLAWGCYYVHEQCLTNIFWLLELSVKSPSVSPPIPSFSGICKVKKFDWIWVWNVETQHLMHKVRE